MTMLKTVKVGIYSLLMKPRIAATTDPRVRFPDMDADFWPIYDMCKEYTQTGPERMYGLYKAIEYINKFKIEGDIVECGVWRGGSAMVIAMTLLKLKDTSRKIFMYDTYEGMTKPTEADFRPRTNTLALDRWNDYQAKNERWNEAPLDEVKSNLRGTGYPEEKLIFVAGKVEDTLPGSNHGQISTLRLDTDWYESTRCEMEELYPKLVSGGILIIDDYGSWIGARKAVDEYLDQNAQRIYLSRMDITGRIAIKN